MKKVILAAVLAVSAISASATELCGTLKIKRIMCVTFPCPQPATLNTGSGHPLNVVAQDGSQAEDFLSRIVAKSVKVCMTGHIVREVGFVATNIEKQRTNKAGHLGDPRGAFCQWAAARGNPCPR